MSILDVRGLCKSYPTFTLKDVSFSLESGTITGFIGRNGAGKTTTLKSLLNFVHPDGGSISFFGLPFSGGEQEIKRRIGFVSGAVDYYPKKKLKTITAVTRSFYSTWDEAAYARYLALFRLEEAKTPSALSAGMKVKYALALALSHNAELLILDEPTSGLDPVSREELLEIFLELSDRGVTILFSTQITSDLDKCADRILYIRQGRLLADEARKTFAGKYRLADFSAGIPAALREQAIGPVRTRDGVTAMFRAEDAEGPGFREADLASVMIHLEKGGEEERF